MLRTRPASSITWRCLVIAWRVTAKPPLSAVRDIGPSSQRRATSRKRVSSPRAAKRRAEPECRTGAAQVLSCRLLSPEGPHVNEETLSRCAWAQSDPLMRAYHDEEWGVPE